MNGSMSLNIVRYDDTKRGVHTITPVSDFDMGQITCDGITTGRRGVLSRAVTDSETITIGKL